jgi:phage anti-repressor protein
MGGQTFEKTKRLDENEYNYIIDNINNLGMIENNDYIYPMRLGNKKTHGDIDIILFDDNKFINLFGEKHKIKEIKTIKLFEERFGLYSQHILTDNLVQIDLLKSYSLESIEITRVFYSYSFANIFLKKITNIIDRNLKFSYLGVLCSSNKFVIPKNVKYIQIDNSTRLIIDCDYIFTLLDLDYNKYKAGFADEFELLNFFAQSKYFSQIKFKNNSGFKHDYLRLSPFANLVNLNLIDVENFNK